MSLRYLVGPVTPERAECWRPFRDRGECLCFGPGGVDVAFRPTEAWDDLLGRLPAGFAPDFVALHLGYTTVPDCLWDAPVPLVALAPDWQFQWHFCRKSLPGCALVFTDSLGVEVMRREGIAQARPLNLFGLQGVFVSPPPGPPPARDIDVLFVGNLSPAVQAERLPWLGRLARLSSGWRVLIAQGVNGEEYRQLLLRSRVAFNRSVKGEWNLRVCEACSCGALLFQEAGHREMASGWAHGVDCVFYGEDDLEALLERYLSCEEERRAVAEAGREKALACTFAHYWRLGVALVEAEWEELRNRSRGRPAAGGAGRLALRAWQELGAADAGDPSLLADLQQATTIDDSPLSLHCAAAVLEAAWTRGRDGRLPADALGVAARRIHRALEANPGHALAALNLVEALEALGQADLAVQGARRLLVRLAGSGLDGDSLDAPRLGQGYDLFRVAWEEAAWQSAGSPEREAEAKRGLVRWRLHGLLADLTGELAHYHEAALARPDVAHTRAALGCALARAGRLTEATPHLRLAVDRNPFDAAAARALYQALRDSGHEAAAEAVAEERRLLRQAAPGLVRPEGWFAHGERVANPLASLVILCCNEAEFTRLCLDSVRRHTRAPYELVLVDNGSTDPTPALLEAVKSWPEPARVAVLRNEKNVGFPAGCNQGAAAAAGDYLVFLNNDTVVTEGWLDGLLAHAQAPGVGMVGAVSNYTAPPQLVEAGYDGLAGLDEFAARRQAEFAGRALEAEVLKGFCLLTPREAFTRAGGFDERYGLGFFDDDDLSLRVRGAGYRLLVALGVFVHHFGSRTFAALGVDTARQLEDNLAVFRAKWGAGEAGKFLLPPGVTPKPDLVVTAMPRGRTVSLCVIARDEEQNIEACLDSARDLVDEVVVVDTGSTDRTKELALARGAKVFDFPWVDSFSAARNACLDRATGAWIFWLDADDRLDEENRDKIRRLFASLPEEGNVGYSMQCRCLPDPVTNTVTVVDHVRLFRRHPAIRWRYRVHEQILGAVKESGGEVRFTDVTVLHTGYADPALRQRKLRRDLRLLEVEHAEGPRDPFTLFNLGATYVELGRHREALPLLAESLARSHPTDSIVRKLYSLLASCHLHLGRRDEALGCCARGQAVCPDDPELLLLEGMIRTEAGDLHGAKAALVRLISTETGPHFASVADGLRTYRGRHQLAVACRGLGEHAEAEGLWRQALAESPGFLPARAGLAHLLLDQRRWDELEAEACAAERLPRGGQEACLIRARAMFARAELAEARGLLEAALETWPDSAPLWEQYGFVLLEQGRDRLAAERALLRLLELEPGNANARRNLGILRAGPPG
jgi:GT2 family glycosyltransferase/Flp pilus assembly protein TadD